MEASVKKQVGERPLCEVAELILEGCKSEKIEGITEEFKNLQMLNLSSVGLVNFDGLPLLEGLRSIDLSDNKELMGESLTTLVEKCPRLYHIILCGTDVKAMDEIKPLASLKELSALDLLDCPVTEVSDYRQQVFSIIPHLKYLDGYDINEDAEDSEDDEEDSDVDGEHAEDEMSDEELDDEDDEEALGGEEGGEGEEEDDDGLAYLDSSHAVQDEDESEDYLADEGATPTSDAVRGLKRKHEHDNGKHEIAGEEKKKEEGATAAKKQNGADQENA